MRYSTYGPSRKSSLVDPAIRAEYAGFLDELKKPDEALAAWKRGLEADPKIETAHYRITRLLIDKNTLTEALAAADNGIQAAPKSARLYLAKSEILEKQGRFYEARRILRTQAQELPDASPAGAPGWDAEDAGRSTRGPLLTANLRSSTKRVTLRPTVKLCRADYSRPCATTIWIPPLGFNANFQEPTRLQPSV